MYEKKVKVLVSQLCQTLCDSMDCSLPASPSMGFSRQEYWSSYSQYSGNWVPISFSSESSQPKD